MIKDIHNEMLDQPKAAKKEDINGRNGVAVG